MRLGLGCMLLGDPWSIQTPLYVVCVAEALPVRQAEELALPVAGTPGNGQDLPIAWASGWAIAMVSDSSLISYFLNFQ